MPAFFDFFYRISGDCFVANFVQGLWQTSVSGYETFDSVNNVMLFAND